MDYSFYTLYTYSIAYILSIFISMEKIPFATQYNIEYLIIMTTGLIKRLFAKFMDSRASSFYILTNAVTVAFFFLTTFILLKLFQFINVYIVIVFEIVLLYSLLTLRTVSDKIIRVYYSLLKYEETEIAQEMEILLKEPEMHGVHINIDSHDKDDIIALTAEIVAKYILEKGNLIASFLLGPAFSVAYKTISMLFGNPNSHNTTYKLYKMLTSLATYINSASLLLTLIILRLDYKNAFRVFMDSRNERTAFGYNEILSIIAGGLDLSLGTPPQDIDARDTHDKSGSKQSDDEFAFQDRLVGNSMRYLEVHDIKAVVDIYYINSVVLFGFALVVRFVVYIAWFQ